MFPSILGGTCAIPGALVVENLYFSSIVKTFKTKLSHIYNGCGERGNEMAEVLEEFLNLQLLKMEK